MSQMIELHLPKPKELHFKQTMLADGETMSYNHAFGGTIDFPRERWATWYERWINNHENKRFYRYIKGNGIFIGEVAYHRDEQRQIWLADVVVYAPYRGRGYGRAALQLLCDAAQARGIRELYDEIAIDNPAITLFLSCGFYEVLRTEDSILIKKELGSLS
jgi:RimJ/RimL family protein N-acetyltransferase